jgi:glycerol-3-phosphate acyltransferase PlsX
VVDGALRACGADPDLQLLLVGPAEPADEVSAGLAPADRERVRGVAVARGVRMSDPASQGADRRTTIGAAALLVSTGEADAVVSAGASGASVAAAVTAIGRTPGVRRPVLAAILPNATGEMVLLDVGAGMQASQVDLLQHAMLGAAYAQLVVGVPRPRVALLTVGAEPGKGDRLRRLTDQALREYALPSGASYVGPVEGDDVVLGTRADVIVTDGFTGNVLIKGIEAALGAAAEQYPPTVVPRAAALLGVAATVVVCHGAASGADLASGIGLAARLVRTGAVTALARYAEAAQARTATTNVDGLAQVAR